MSPRLSSSLLLLPLLAAAAHAALDKGALLRLIDENCRSAKIEREIKEWRGLEQEFGVRERKKELTRQLHAAKRDDNARKSRVAAAAERVLKSGRIDAADAEGQTLLMAVAEMGVDEATNAVLKEKPDLSLCDAKGHTALWHERRGMGHALSNRLTAEWQAAMEAGNAEAVRHLMDCGVPPTQFTKNGNPPLGEAIERGLQDVYDELRKQDMPCPAPMADGRSLLAVAVEKSNAQAIAHLLFFGVDAEERMNTGERPVRYLLRCGQPEALLAYLKGADLGNRAEEDTRVCCLAARFSSPEMLRALLAGVPNPHEEDAYGNTPILEAARRGDPAVYDAVAESRPPAWENSRRETALMHAALSGNPEMLRRVLDTMPAELRNRTDAAGRTAADFAALSPNPAPLLQLLSQPTP